LGHPTVSLDVWIRAVFRRINALRNLQIVHAAATPSVLFPAVYLAIPEIRRDLYFILVSAVHIMIYVAVALQIYDLILLLNMLVSLVTDFEISCFISFQNIQSSFVKCLLLFFKLSF